VECPTCRYRVPAEWSLCRRCGAPLRPELEDNRIPLPASMHRPESTDTDLRTRPAPTSSALAAIATARRNGPPAAPPAQSPAHPLLPDAPTAATPGIPVGARLGAIAGRHWRRILVLAVVGIALATSLVAVWPVMFRSSPHTSAPPTSVAQEAVATDLLKTVIGGGRAFFATGSSFAPATPAALSTLSFRVPIVASTIVARSGTVSMRVDSRSEITFATPADNERCVFARDQPAKPLTQFVTVRTPNCRASTAPASGWSTP
jgi:hypothetical protein